MFNDILQALYDLPLSETIRESTTMFPWLESVHVLAIGLVLGSIAAVDLRLMGFASMRRPVTLLVRQVLPLTWCAFAVALVTGLAMFASNALKYAGNTPFRLKMVLLLLAGINMVVFHLVTYRTVGTWDTATRTPAFARLAGGTSIVAWVLIVASGRWIGFV